VRGVADSAAAFLSGMSLLQHLTALQLAFNPSHFNWPPLGPSYSALTASSNLVSLSLTDASVPAGAWLYVFPTSLQLPNLTRLEAYHTVDYGAHTLPCAWGAADVASLVSCWPTSMISPCGTGRMCLSCNGLLP
jgi:hypothetical protein